jgi:cytochrome oxidase Cu insertion factor (SCO1/SenC/PrrC family)
MKAPSFRVISQYIGLFFLLVVFPGVSWIYLQSGFNYQKKLRSELKDLGVVPDFSLLLTTGDTLTLDSLQDRVSIACFIDTREKINTPLKMQVIRDMLEQFHDQELDFLIHTANPSSDSLSVLREFAIAATLDKNHQCKFLTGSEEEIRKLAAEGYKMPDKFPLNENPYFVLTARQMSKDSTYSRIIKSYCDIRNIDEKKKLVEHAVMLMSLVDKKVKGR